ncbi:MAG: peptidoglycan-binding protein [Chitinophagales bacterium]|nr:peptidoglycan-binding protein [Chitinophagales bacterium]
MKKVLLSILSLGIVLAQAQIFINTNPNANSSQKTVQETKTEVNTTVEEVVEPVKTEVNTTKTTVTTPVVTSPVVTTPVVTTPTLTTPTVTTTTVTTPTTTTNYSAPKVASNVSEDVPPNAVPGKCYARCFVEDKYGYVNETVVDQPQTTKQMKLPALVKTVFDTVVITPQQTKTINIPAQYETITEQVMITPATTKWVKGKADAGCLSANPADCQVMCLVEIPAVYKTVSKEVLKNQAYSREETIPMQYKVVAKEIVIEKERLVEVVTPATYKTVQKRVVVEKGGYQVWREILCSDDLTQERILDIQKALLNAGYNPGPIDNVFGAMTKSALIQYQKDKGLPVGNLNLETLKALGVN